MPIPLRVLAAAGGLNLDELLRQKDDDLALRKQLAEYNKQVAAYAPAPADDGTGEASSQLRLQSTSGVSSVLHANGGRRPALLNRDFDNELLDRSKTGKAKVMSSTTQRKRNQNIDKLIIKAAKEHHRRTIVETTSPSGNNTSSF